jgi:hypothetical protein
LRIQEVKDSSQRSPTATDKRNLRSKPLEFKNGHAIVTIRKTNSGKTYLTVPLPFGASSVAKVFEEEELAVTWERFVFDDANIVMRTEFTPNRTTITFHADVGDGVIGEAITQGLSQKIRRKYNLPGLSFVFSSC